MKEFKNIATPGKDVTIFYSSLEELPIKISILRELIKIYPNMELGSVPIACASIKDLPFIGLCNNGICSLLTNGTMKNIRTYNDMISNIFESVLDHFISSYILNSSEFSEKTKIKFSEFKKNGIVNNSRKEMFGALIYYTIHLNQEEKSQIQNYLQTMMQDSLRKKIIIDFFMKNVRIAYNVNNGFSYDYESNIAFDSWYINKKLVAKENINVFHMYRFHLPVWFAVA